jgi:pyruvate/2-oxoacid:ferredoxin oxidoreductase alpha subunit
MRAGPGLGNIAPEQGDIKLACRGLGHGNTHAIVLAPADPQEMLDLTMLAFELTFRYRNPVVILGDGYLGQVTGKVTLPDSMIKPGLPGWAVYGDGAHRHNLHASIRLQEDDQEAFNEMITDKYARMTAAEQRADCFRCDDAEVVLVASNTPARMVKGAIQTLRSRGVAAGLFRPITLWPFPIEAFEAILPGVRRLIVVEASNGQLEDELRLALSRAGITDAPEIEHVRRMGGNLPQTGEILELVLGSEEVAS